MSNAVAAPLRYFFADLAAAMKQAEGSYEPPVQHFRLPGLYGRMAMAFADSCVVSYVHKVDHFTFILEGQAFVIDQDGNRNYVEAPAVFATKAGTQRTVVAITDIIWMTVHPDRGTTDADNENMEGIMCCTTFEEYEAYVAALPSPEEI